MTSDDKKSWAEELLREKHKELGRLPRKDDFDEPTRSRIKAFLGPWPRALEAAGLKEPRPIAPKSAKRKKSATKSKKQAILFKIFTNNLHHFTHCSSMSLINNENNPLICNRKIFLLIIMFYQCTHFMSCCNNNRTVLVL